MGSLLIPNTHTGTPRTPNRSPRGEQKFIQHLTDLPHTGPPHHVYNPLAPNTGIAVILLKLRSYNYLKYQLCTNLCPPSMIPILCLKEPWGRDIDIPGVNVFC